MSMTEFERERDEAAEEYRKEACDEMLNWGTAEQLAYGFNYKQLEAAFVDGCDWANARAEKKVQVLVEALEMAKFCMNAFIEKVPQTDLVTRDLMQIEVNRYSEALAEYRGEK